MRLVLLATFSLVLLQVLWVCLWLARGRLSPVRRRVLLSVFVLFNLPTPYIIYLVITARTAGPFVAALLLRPAFAWQFFWLLASLVWLMVIPVRGIRWLVRRRHPGRSEPSPVEAPTTSNDRRRGGEGAASGAISRRWFCRGAVAAGAAVAGYGLARTASAPQVTSLSIPIARLPGELSGLRVLHLSDIHLGFYTASEEVGRVIEMCRPLRPDLAVITGDLVDHNPRYALILGRILSGMKVPLGWYATIGNHDIYAGAAAITHIMREHGVSMLRDQHVDLGRRGIPLLLAGTDDTGVGWAGSGGLINLDRALARAPRDRVAVLLAHRPTAFDQAIGRDIALTLAGHTHGGQLSLPFGGPGLAHLSYRRPRGHYMEGGQHLYVSRGIGCVGLPFRLGSPPEIVLVTLTRS